MSEVTEGVDGQCRTQVAPTDPEVDHRFHRPSCSSPSLAVADLRGECGHPVKGGPAGLNLGESLGYSLWAPHGTVDRWPTLRRVDRVADQGPLQRADDLSLGCQVHEKPHGLVGHVLVGEVDPKVGALEAHPDVTRWVIGKQVAEVGELRLGVVLELRPGRGGVGRPTEGKSIVEGVAHGGHSPPAGR